MEIWYAQSIKTSFFILHSSFRCLFWKELAEINSTVEDEVHHSCLNEATSLTWGERLYRAEGKVPTKKLYIEVKCVIISFAPCVRKTMTILTWDVLYNFVWRARRAGASQCKIINKDWLLAIGGSVEDPHSGMWWCDGAEPIRDSVGDMSRTSGIRTTHLVQNQLVPFY